MRPRTRMIHGGIPWDPHTGAVTVPLHLTSTFRQQGPGEHAGFEYARTGNPTRAALESLVADLEGGARALAFSSGMAAITAIFALFDSGDHVVVSDDVYGGTYRVLSRVFARFGLEATFVDTSDPAAVEPALRPTTRAVFVETPTNPLMKVTDIEAVAALARRHGLLTICDTTFLSPYFIRPLELGADIVVHSATKYLGGHSDLVAGVAAVRDAELGERLHFLLNATGGVCSPFDAWLLIRGIRTLALRMEAHQANALRLARWLRDHPRVRAVHYPGLEDHPGHGIMKRQATGFGGMLSFDVGDAGLADRVLRRVRLIALAESLGGVESLINLPAKMTHASIPPERRAQLGITDSLIRLSVGIEDAEDLIEDLAQALEG
ncbi:MAG TPA: bifunctional cystathionine gamma-lyase/homocysteine desulfhydrase [Bacillota bacterium]